MEQLLAGADPVNGLIGGVLIGLAGLIMLLGIGRIAGVSGIASRAIGLSDGNFPRLSAWLFVVGLMIGGFLVAATRGVGDLDYVPLLPLVIAGLLVGFGTRLGSGCTSGHGVCGVSRLSARSIVATLTFIASGIATVAIVGVLN